MVLWKNIKNYIDKQGQNKEIPVRINTKMRI